VKLLRGAEYIAPYIINFGTSWEMLTHLALSKGMANEHVSLSVAKNVGNLRMLSDGPIIHFLILRWGRAFSCFTYGKV